jgi:predicted NUDIX family NTP pyrophosphohydrolase
MKLNQIQDQRQSVVAALKQAITRAAGKDSRLLTFEILQSREGSPELAVRDFGKWVVPDGEEDDGDYDWQVPTANTWNAVEQLVADVKRQFPAIVIAPYTGEKNWIYFAVREQ